MGSLSKYKNHFIHVNATAREALQKLDILPETESRTLFVLNEKVLVGTLTDGDIRRGLLQDKEISDSVAVYMNRRYKCLYNSDVKPEVLAKYREQEIWLLPVISEKNEVQEIIDLKSVRTVLPAAALIMAGGRGERLRPLTDTLPKPMLTVGEKPILEINIDRLIQYGICKFYISVRYLSDKIIEHFGDGSSKNISIEYIKEEEPLGTIGACTKIDDLGYEQLLVINSDILTNIDYEDFYNYYKASNALMCTASVPYKLQIPYGIMQTNETDSVTALVEKPTYTYYANAGIYFLDRSLLGSIPKHCVYNATDLMQCLIDQKRKLVHYPILQYWLDIGKYEDYIRAQEEIKHLKF